MSNQHGQAAPNDPTNAATIAFELEQVFQPDGYYSINGGTHIPCMEHGGPASLCRQITTYPCEHLDHGSQPHWVCHTCRLAPCAYSLVDEEQMIVNNRLYLCHECTELRSQLPQAQIWTHPLRAGETRTRRQDGCRCYDELQVNWLCRHHRLARAGFMSRLGPELVRSHRNFFQGTKCPSCHTNPPQAQGLKVMWVCTFCADPVIQEHRDGD
jgi:hypothetical protein